MKFPLAVVLDGVARWCLYIALALVPVFFLPFTAYAVTLNKQTLFVGLMFLAAIAWLAKTVAAGELAYVKSPLNAAVGGLVLFTIVD